MTSKAKNSMSRINKVWFDELMLVRYMGPYKSTHIAALRRELRHPSRHAAVVELAAVNQLVNCSLSTAVSYDMLILLITHVPTFKTACKMTSQWCVVAGPVSAKNTCILLRV